MSPDNDFLRVGEFRRWAALVDQSLLKLADKVESHSETLAVVRDRMAQDDEKARQQRNLRNSVIGLGISSLVTLAVQAWHFLTTPK